MATTYYTDQSIGSDSNPGTEASPKLTMAAGASLLSVGAGDTLLVKTGTYVEPALTEGNIPGSTSWGLATRIAAYPGSAPYDVVTLAPGGGTTSVFSFAGAATKYIIIEGIIVDATGVLNNCVKITFFTDPATTHASFIRLLNCELKNSLSNGILNTRPAGDGCEYLYNHVHHNGDTDHDHGIYHAGVNGLGIGNHIHDNSGFGIHNFENNGGVHNNVWHSNDVHDNALVGIAGGAIIGSGTNNQFYNNLLYDNQGVGLMVRYSGSNNGKVYNNTIVGNLGEAVSVQFSSGDIIRNNILRGNGTNAVVIDSGTTSSITASNNVTVDPLFVDGAGPTYDFHLTPGSPAIDAGFDVSSVLTTDYDGNTRILPFDAGAYEFTSSGNINSSVAEATAVGESATMVIAAPINTVPGAQTITTNVQTAIAGISVSGGAITMRVTVLHGTLHVTASGAATIS